jgi:hypothetical protein
MEAVNTAPSGRNQEVGGTVMVHVTHRHGIKPEGVSRDSTGECLDEMAVLSGV